MALQEMMESIYREDTGSDARGAWEDIERTYREDIEKRDGVARDDALAQNDDEPPADQ